MFSHPEQNSSSSFESHVTEFTLRYLKSELRVRAVSRVLRPAEGDCGDRRACVPSPNHDGSEAPSVEFSLQVVFLS